MAAFAPAAFAADGYTEIWNPPEARVSAPHRVRTVSKPVTRRHFAPHRAKFATRRPASSAAHLMAKQNAPQKTAPSGEPDMSNLPRLITPEGNVLRVRTDASSIGIVR
jgi:hypothetical protein